MSNDSHNDDCKTDYSMDSPYARRFEGLPFLDVIAKAPISSKSDVFRQCVLARSGGLTPRPLAL